MERIVKHFLIALLAFGAVTTSANARGLKQHVCHQRGAYDYYCHWHPVPSLKQALSEGRVNAEAAAAGILYQRVTYTRWCAYPDYYW
jgi:hypothetical protein